ncbi:RNA 2'-phosphotransferase [Clavibacter tessellarius]|uniref:RNA 2'-phosphotransferase n=1 Tax=Clavibacter tessellarius TaxID=31965 RepID=UPI0039E883E1
MARPSPTSVARLHASAAQRPFPDTRVDTLSTSFPSIVTLAEQYGLDVADALDRWVSAIGAAGVSALIVKSTPSFEVAKYIREAASRDSQPLPLLAYLLAEERLRDDAAGIAGYLKSAGTSMPDIYLQLIERLGESFLNTAFEATWKRRAIFSRALNASRAYLGYVKQDADLSNARIRRGTLTRLGMSTVLLARFGPVQEQALREARTILLHTHEQGSEQALTYYIEASNWLYDLFGDEDAVREAARLFLSDPRRDGARCIAGAHTWLRLAGSATSSEGRAGFIRRGRESLQSSALEDNFSRKEEIAARTLLLAMFDALETQAAQGYSDLDTRCVLFPFGLRRPDTAMPKSYYRALPELIDSLRNSEHYGDYLFRDLRADLHSYFARASDTGSIDAESSLRTAIQLRLGRGHRERPLGRAGVEVDIAEDYFLLATINNSVEDRRAGFRSLLKAPGSAPSSPRHLTLMAKELDANGPLRGFALEGPDEYAFAIQSGDTNAMFSAAARVAYQSADLAHVQLGGRSGVVSLRDVDGSTGQTFVFKTMSREGRDRDAAFTSRVLHSLNMHELSTRYGIIEHLTEIQPVSQSRPGVSEIISVRRYSNGFILGQHLPLQSDALRLTTLCSTAEYLALIHHAGVDGRSTSGARRELRSKELGRWLRALTGDDGLRDGLFNRWWDEIADAPLLPRRDAHPMNWLVDVDNRILAVDLESTGVRPYGYEIAQLVEDGQLLAPGDWESRRAVVNAYTRSWQSISGEIVSETDAFRFYQLGAIARAVRAISLPSASSETRAFGGKLLEALSSRGEQASVRALAFDLSQLWARQTGRVGDDEFQILSNADRRRISRAMAYRLRHDPSTPATKDGWVHVDELTELLRSSGHKVTSAQLILIAGALGEQRFELEGYDIRAVYGHSTRTNISYSSKNPPNVLYHATPLRNLKSILEARAGLVPGRRNWVHLTDSCSVALNAARRQQASVAVLEIDTAALDGLVYATGSTWLAKEVPAGQLKLLPLREMHELIDADNSALDER